MNRLLPLLFALLLTLSPLVGAEQCSVEMRLDRSKCLIGDWLRLDVITESSENYQPLWPDWREQSLGSFRVLSADRLNPAHQQLTVAVYDLNRQVIPSFTFPFIDLRDSTTFTLQTDSIAVQVFTVQDSMTLSSVPIDSATAPLLDIYPPQQRPLTWQDWTLLAGAIVAALLLFWLLIQLWRRRTRSATDGTDNFEKYLPPPGERARTELHRIRDEKLWQRGEVVEHYFRITLLLRRYLEWQTGEVVAEMTTFEVEEFLTRIHSPQPGTLLLNMLQQSDLVKFATYLPAEERHDQFWEEALQLLEAWEGWFKQSTARAVEDAAK
jgi:hypothetical protein